MAQCVVVLALLLLPVSATEAERKGGWTVYVLALPHPADKDVVEALNREFRQWELRVVADGNDVLLEGRPHLVGDAVQRLKDARPAKPPPAGPAGAPAPAPAAKPARPRTVRLIVFDEFDPERAGRLLRRMYGPAVEVTVRPESRSLLLEGGPDEVGRAAATAMRMDGETDEARLTAAALIERSDRAARRMLDAVSRTLNLPGIPLNQALEFIRDIWHADITVNYEALEAAGIQADAEVNITSLRNVSLRGALELVFDQVGAKLEPAKRPALLVIDGRIVVSTRGELDRKISSAVYDVRDLAAGGGEAGRKERMAAIIGAVRALDPSGFSDAKDARGDLRELDGLLIIRQTAEVQGKIRMLLGELRDRLAGPER